MPQMSSSLIKSAFLQPSIFPFIYSYLRKRFKPPSSPSFHNHRIFSFKIQISTLSLQLLDTLEWESVRDEERGIRTKRDPRNNSISSLEASPRDAQDEEENLDLEASNLSDEEDYILTGLPARFSLFFTFPERNHLLL